MREMVIKNVRFCKRKKKKSEKNRGRYFIHAILLCRISTKMALHQRKWYVDIFDVKSAFFEQLCTNSRKWRKSSRRTQGGIWSWMDAFVIELVGILMFLQRLTDKIPIYGGKWGFCVNRNRIIEEKMKKQRRKMRTKSHLCHIVAHKLSKNGSIPTKNECRYFRRKIRRNTELWEKRIRTSKMKTQFQSAASRMRWRGNDWERWMW